LIALAISKSYSKKSSIRCKTNKDPDKNGRIFKDIKFEPELEKLINDYRKRFGYVGDDLESTFSSAAQNPTKDKLRPFSDEEIQSIDSEAKSISVLLEGFNGEERDIIAKYRLNQGKFRKLLLNYWDGTCAVTGLGEERLLLASHILPWSKSTNNQKGDPYNGLLLSVVWDSLFDKGLISFDDEGKVIFNKLSDEVINCFGLKVEEYAINFEKLTNEHRQYLQMHRFLHKFE